MRALIYVTKRSFINKAKRALKKPLTLLLIIICSLYAVFIAFALGGVVVKLRFDSPKGLLALMTLWTLYNFLLSFAGYSSRKGIMFKPYHARFIFPAPISPKAVLLHGAWLNYVIGVLIGLLFFVAGVSVFQVPVWKMLIYFLVGFVMENIMETSIMVYFYANEKIPLEAFKWVGRIIKAALVLISLFVLLYFKTHGFTLTTASAFIDWRGLLMIPVVGWNIAVYHLLLTGPTVLNVVCSCLYLLTVLSSFIVARRMKCEGGYYEDAAKFADDFAELRQRKKNGEMVMGMKKKKKYRRITESFGATGAKTIFYKQLLEYKKEKYFIFTKTTLVSLVIAVIFSWFLRHAAMNSGFPQFYLLGIVGYMTLILSGTFGKWENELKNPYLFLIPDNPIKKLWYSTLMEHIKALLDGCVFCIPLGVAWHIKPAQIVFTILIYTILQANRIYTKVIAQCLLGDTLGKKGQDFVRCLIQMALLGVGIGVAAAVGLAVNLDLVFPIILIYSIIITVIIGLLASIRFNTMEQIG